MTTDLQQIQQMVQAGRISEAQKFLEDILRADPKNLQAWSLYVKSWGTIEKRIKALELCLKYNPENETIRRALETLKAQAGSSAPQPPAPKPAPIAPPVAAPQPRADDAMPAWLAGSAASAVSSYPSQEEIEKRALEHEMEDRRRRAGIGRPIPWFEVWYIALTQANIDAYDALRLNPYAMPSRTYLWLILAGLFPGLIVTLTLGFNPQFYQALQMLEQNSGGTDIAGMFSAGMFCLLPFSGVMNLIGMAISVGIMHLLAKAFGGNGKYPEFLYLTAAYSAPMTMITSLLSLIPFIGSCLTLPLSFWSFNLMIQSIKSAHNLDTARALGVILSLLLMNVIIFGCIVLAIYSAIAPYIDPALLAPMSY